MGLAYGTVMRTLARLTLFVVIALSVWFALVMRPTEAGIPVNDSLVHGLSFFCLTLLSAAAFPAIAPRMLIVSMAVIGAIVEAVQAIPFIGRDASLGDWLADGIGIVAAIAIVAMFRHFRAQPVTDKD